MVNRMAPHGDVLVIPGPIKGVPRIDQKTAEKYGGRFDQVKDVTRITIDCPSIAVMYTVVEVLLDEDALEMVLLDFKDRLDRMKCNPADSGGYLDLLFNFCFKGSAHIFEVQVTLRRFLEIKNAIGHRAYHVARRLNAYSKFVREYHGALTPEALHGIKSGLFISASFDGTRLDPAYITEFSEAISSDTCRLVTLSARACDLSGWNLELFVNGKITDFDFLMCSGLEGDIAVFRFCPQITSLDLYYTCVSGDISVFEFCPNVTDVILSSTKVSGNIQVLIMPKPGSSEIGGILGL